MKSNDTQISLSSKIGEVGYGDTADQLSNFKINTLPPEEVYIPLVNGIELYMDTWDEREENGGSRRKKGKKKDDYDYDKANKMRITYFFRVKEKDGRKKITEFVEVTTTQSLHSSKHILTSLADCKELVCGAIEMS